jgi:hypothetical protein
MELLRQLMDKAGIKSYQQLSQLARTSTRTIFKIRSGNIDAVRWGTIVNIAAVFQLSPHEFLNYLGAIASPSPSNLLQQEYDRLQQQLIDDRHQSEQESIAAAINQLESFLTYYPTAKQAAIDRPDFPATKLIPLVAPVEDLIANWGVTAIGSIGLQLPYNPQLHQPIDGTAAIGEPVKIRYLGYTIGDRLLFRARVSRVF